MKRELVRLIVFALTWFALCSSATAQTDAEWQKVVQAAKKEGKVPTVKGVIERADPALREMLSAKVLGTTQVERQNEMLELAAKIYK